MGIGFILRVIVSIILVIGMMSFVLLYTISGEIEQGAVEEVVDDVVDIGSDRINLEGEIDYSLLYDSLLSECQNKEKIYFNTQELPEGIEIDCNEIRFAGRDGIEDLIKEKIEEILFGEIDETGIVQEIVEKEKVDRILWTIGAINLILIIIIILLARIGALVNLGIVGMISGLPFVIAGIFKNLVENLLIVTLPFGISLSELPALKGLIYDLTKDLFVSYLILFVLGAALFGLGIGIKTGLGKKKEAK
ncbi:hypothetical protein CO038_00310 [Candidatus Pacearchaeota archaeon CG_4_9_14_0_2_um_filter_39_13]|nr:hypothetical protein [Candidatus Pacearchaeota archaeon]OIO44017.1 MAG: hypothetical protein AUJ64_00945 [Candidatus Pacearchaeota archaeon CG1_02_39_14]PJC45117.1 MAG: hypothetical protein CO038_00310 [Candidatus Pacearchaeota archaeon CG_4_9_14_0_2_um_filter_39_13]